MNQKMTDTELLEALKHRLDTSRNLLREQEALMEQLRSVNGKLIASEQLKTDFLSNIRNEINNPVASILGLSQSIAEEETNLASIRKLAALLHSEIFNLDFQLRNIFLSAEVEAGEATPCVSGVQVVSLLENVARSFQPQIAKRDIHFHLSCSISRETLFYTDPGKLHLIVSNLLSNAIRYNYNGGIIGIDCAISNGQLVLTVSDSGVGIAEEFRGRVFDRFWQREAGSDKNYSGHGLGLSITKALIEILGGTITLESEEGKGCRFTVQLVSLEPDNSENDIFSADGNDFLFSDKMIF